MKTNSATTMTVERALELLEDSRRGSWTFTPEEGLQAQRVIQQLKAAAPDLYKQLQRVELWLGDFCDQGVLDNHPAYRLWTDVRATLETALRNARAEG